ncbi:MAG TPA: vWA domain-containing protein, partial [Myxococcota bacterium]|nr:vWA domain-containing protein [Myxococcota bacterium]
SPEQGSFTRLFSAVDYSLDDLARLRGPEVPPNAHNVLVVLSDGQDNHSATDLPPVDRVLQLSGGLSYREGVGPATSLARLTEKIAARADITVHTLGMGSDVNDAELQAIATAGHGVFLKNPEGTGIGALFEQISREFGTLQTSGVTLPNPSGECVLTVQVTQHSSSARGRLSFRLHVGDAGAQVLGPA